MSPRLLPLAAAALILAGCASTKAAVPRPTTATRWSLLHHTVGRDVFGGPTLTVPIAAPGHGQLLTASVWGTSNLSGPTSSTISDPDGDAAGAAWTPLGVVNVADHGVVATWWKVADAGDQSSLRSVTFTVSGGTGTDTVYGEVDDWAVASPGVIEGVDIAGRGGNTKSSFTFTVTASAGSTLSPPPADEMAFMTVIQDAGANPNGTNRFTGDSPPAPMALADSADPNSLANLYAFGVRSSPSAVKDTWQASYDNKGQPTDYVEMLCATFFYTTPAGG